MGFSSDPFHLQLLQVTATLSTIGLFLCGIPICLEIRRRRSTEDITSLPFVMGFIGSCFWLRYGMLTGEISVVIVNSIGSLLMFSYLFFYLLYAKSKLCIFLQIVADIILIDAMCILVDLFRCDDQQSICLSRDVLGFFCMLFNIITFGAPLAGLAVVIKTRCCESLPLPLCSANLIVAMQWCLFGILKRDHYIIIPNAVGILLALIQIALFLVFSRVRPVDSRMGWNCQQGFINANEENVLQVVGSSQWTDQSGEEAIAQMTRSRA